MSRTYTPETLVALPRLSGPTANVLITRILTAASTAADAGQPLPPALAGALGRLTKANQELALALQPIVSDGDGAAAQSADNTLDRGYGNMYKVLSAWDNSDPGDNPDPEGTDRLMQIFFADGLSFLNLKYDLEWQASKSKLDLFASDPANLATARKLGLEPWITKVQQAQADFGLALGITQVLEDPESAQVRAMLNPALSALRSYVVQVVAFGDARSENAQSRADALLEPLTSWEYPPSSSSSSST